MHTVTAVPTSLDAPDLLQWLEAVLPEDLDELPFGIIAMAPDCTVQRYNLAESRLSGLTPARVIGRHMFSSVATCINTPAVAHRFMTEKQIDDVINYVFTFRMAPMRVRLRLMKHPKARFMYLAIEPRD